MSKTNGKKDDSKVALKKGIAQFMLIGEAKLNDYTFKMDATSQKSDWQWNQLNLGVDCGNGNIVYAEMMGGYGTSRDNVIYVHGVKEDENKKRQEDWENKFTIAWEDRFDETILETIGDSCFIKVGLESKVNKDGTKSTFVQKFLSAYDAIAYIEEHLKSGMVINVKGDLKYSIYNGVTQVKKEIKSVFISKIEEKSKYKASFTQTMLLDKGSLGKLDKEKAVYPIHARVIDYVKTYNDKEVKQNIPFAKTFELEVNKSNPEATKKFIDKIIKVRKGVTEVTFEGELLEGVALVTVTDDDIPDDIKELIEMGIYTREEVVDKFTAGNGRERRMIIKKPAFKMIGEGDEAKKAQISITTEKYDEDDLILDFMLEEPEVQEEVEDAKETKSTTKETTKKVVEEESDEENVESEDENAWMDALDDMAL